MRAPKMVVFCVDGGVADTVRRHGLFDIGTRFPRHAGGAATVLPSIFPSSTAPAHASFLTGVDAGGHGIVGNRFWSGEPVADIRGRVANPVATLHPYEHTSLTAPSLLDWFAAQGASTAAVQFPQTFSRRPFPAQCPALYCLYAPARSVDVTLAEIAYDTFVGGCVLEYYEQPVEVTVTDVAEPDGERAMLVQVQDGDPVRLRYGATGRVRGHVREGEVSFAITPSALDGRRVRLAVGTAVLTMTFGGLTNAELAHLDGPSSLSVEYTASPDHDFHEAPRADWIGRAAVRVAQRHEPDVLFVRFNQADHAQEFLHWHAARGGRAESTLARAQILQAYRTIEANVMMIAETLGPDTSYVFFSDHGIDWVETHIRPDSLLEDLGWTDRMIFQGDSNCAYLYADTPLGVGELEKLTLAVTSLHPSVRVLDAAGLRSLGLPAGGPRIGRLAITSGAHTEFQYSPGPRCEAVRSASHGYLPADPAMSGFFRMSGPGTEGLPAPRGLTAAADVVRTIWQRRREQSN